MNKLAAIACVLLLLLGGAQWYLASNSLTPYVNQQLQTISRELIHHHLTVEGIAIATNSGTAHVDSFKLSPENNTPTITLENIGFLLNKKSVKKEIIEIELISIERAILHLDKTLSSTNILKIINSLSDLLSKSNRPLNSLIDGNESLVTLDNIVIQNLNIIFYENGVPVEEQIFAEQKMTGIKEETGLPVSVLMTQLLQKILDSILVNQVNISAKG